MEPAPVTPPAGPGWRAKLALAALAALAATLCCATGLLAVALRHELRTAFSTLDGRFVLQVDSDDPAIAKETWRVLRARLRRAEVPGRLSNDGGRIVIEHRAEDADAVRALTTTRGDLRFMLVVEDLSEVERQHVLVHLVSARRPDGSLPDDEPRDVLRLEDELLVLERPGFGGPGTFKRAHKALDASGRPALGFELEEEAAVRFRALTRASIGRRMAIVLDGQVRSAPVIRSEIGAKGIVEGGGASWADGEVELMAAVLSSDPLPARLVPVPGQ